VSLLHATCLNQDRCAQAVMKNMNKLFLILFFLTNISFAQSNDQFLSDFLLEDELESSNSIDQFKEFDFSKVWMQTDNDLIYGIIGEEHQRIRIKLISIEKNPQNPSEYLVYGKSMVKENICDFKGIIKIKEIREIRNLHFGVDSSYKNKGIKSQGILIADYEFKENKEQEHSGIFIGQLYTKWYLDKNKKIRYDDIQSISDSYSNNAFIGVWINYKTRKEKICNWADYRVPKANQDFDIGAGEFSVAEKYLDKGWFDIALKNQVPNGAIKRNKESTKSKEWWQ